MMGKGRTGEGQTIDEMRRRLGLEGKRGEEKDNVECTVGSGASLTSRPGEIAL